jgi:hypothetical protein
MQAIAYRELRQTTKDDERVFIQDLWGPYFALISTDKNHFS